MAQPTGHAPGGHEPGGHHPGDEEVTTPSTGATASTRLKVPADREKLRVEPERELLRVPI